MVRDRCGQGDTRPIPPAPVGMVIVVIAANPRTGIAPAPPSFPQAERPGLPHSAPIPAVDATGRRCRTRPATPAAKSSPSWPAGRRSGANTTSCPCRGRAAGNGTVIALRESRAMPKVHPNRLRAIGPGGVDCRLSPAPHWPAPRQGSKPEGPRRRQAARLTKARRAGAPWVLPNDTQLATRNGLTMRRRPSNDIPCCMSSDHSVSQSAWSADAAIIAS